MKTRLALVMLAVLSACLSGCALRTRLADFPGTTQPIKSMYVVLKIQDMYAHHLPGVNAITYVISADLSQIRGNSTQYTAYSCVSSDANVEVTLAPSLGMIDDGKEDRYYYNPGHYTLRLEFGATDAKKAHVPAEGRAITLVFNELSRRRMLFEMEAQAFDEWYIVSATTAKDPMPSAPYLLDCAFQTIGLEGKIAAPDPIP